MSNLYTLEQLELQSKVYHLTHWYVKADHIAVADEFTSRCDRKLGE